MDQSNYDGYPTMGTNVPEPNLPVETWRQAGEPLVSQRTRWIARETPKPQTPEAAQATGPHGKLVMGTRVTELGKKTQAMTSANAARVMSGRRCGLLAAERGTAYRWTSETARKAAVKSWTKRRKFNHRIGTRIGVKAARRPAQWREPLREYYAENPTRGITYNTFSGQWYRDNRIVIRACSFGGTRTLTVQGRLHPRLDSAHLSQVAETLDLARYMQVQSTRPSTTLTQTTVWRLR
jgi:hypothetical protein